MRAEVIRLPNPFDPAHREVAVLRRPLRIRRLMPRDRPVLAMLNGRPLLRAGWRRRLRDGDRLAIVFLPRGGGGGGGGSNPLRLILSLALMWFAPWAAGQLLGVAGTAGGLAGTAALFGGFTIGQATALGIYMAGNALINAVLPPPRPTSLPEASPTYSIQAQGNAARLDAPIPVQYGRLKVYPDFGAQPYAEFAGNEQYVYQLLCLGAGQFEIEQLLIEDTPLTSFSEIEVQVVNPGEQVTLFPTAVASSVEVSGQEMVGTSTGSWTRSGTTLTVTETDHLRAVGQAVVIDTYATATFGVYGGDTLTISEPGHSRLAGQSVALQFPDGQFAPMTITITSVGTDTWQVMIPGYHSASGTVHIRTPDELTGVHTIASVIDEDHYTLTTATAATGSGTTDICTVIGAADGFVANAAASTAHRLGVDFIMPRGLYAVSGGGLANMSLSVRVEAQRIDDLGAPLGAWALLGEHTFTDRTNTPPRITTSYSLTTPGRYRVRAWRTDAESTDTNVGHEVLLAGLRAYLSEPQDFGPVTLLAVRMRASNNLSAQASRKLAVVCTRKLPVWTGSAWTAPQATRSIAWALADAARNADYGAKLGDDRLDLPALLALHATWTARGDRFDGRFDSATTWWEAARKICIAGRAQPYLQGGRLRVVRDGPATIPTMLFSERNIVQGSFGIDFTMPSEATADAVDVGIFDGGIWAPRRIRATLPGSTAATPVKVDLFGVTDADQALRDGLYQAAANRYRRETVTFETEMEGYIPSIGDLIAVQHSMPGWGQQAEVVAWEAATRTLTLSEPLDWSGSDHVIGLRKRNGGVIGPYACTRGTADHLVQLATAPSEAPYTGSGAERTHVAFGRSQTWRALAKVTGIRPRGLYRVAIDAVVEDPSVHTAETGAVAPPVSYSALPKVPVLPVVSQLLARMVPDDPDRVVISWRPAPGATGYQVEMAEGAALDDPDVSWTRVAETTASQMMLTVLYPARTMVRVRAIGMAPGPWSAAAVGVLVGLYWLHPESAFWGADPALHWRP